MNKRLLRILGILACVPLLILAFIYRDSKILWTIGTIEAAISGIVIFTFIVIYSRRNWRMNPYGRALMYSKISLGLLAILSVLTGYFGSDWEYRPLFRTLALTFVMVAQTRLVHLLFITKAGEPKISNGKDSPDDHSPTVDPKLGQ